MMYDAATKGRLVIKELAGIHISKTSGDGRNASRR
jgi:hypothetical protein